MKPKIDLPNLFTYYLLILLHRTQRIDVGNKLLISVQMFCINNFKIFNDYKENQAIFSMKTLQNTTKPIENRGLYDSSTMATAQRVIKDTDKDNKNYCNLFLLYFIKYYVNLTFYYKIYLYNLTRSTYDSELKIY